jgi:hypothetical protein
MLPPSAKGIGRAQAAQGVTLGLGLAYGVGALGFAPPTQRIAPGWIGQVDFWPSLVLAGGALYGCAWLYGGWAGAAIKRRPARAAGVGAAYGALTLLTVTLVGSGWSFAQEAVRFAPFPGTTSDDVSRHVGDSLYDYVVKPLVWIMPLGSVVAAGLGAWFGRRVRQRLGQDNSGLAARS